MQDCSLESLGEQLKLIVESVQKERELDLVHTLVQSGGSACVR